MYESRPRSSPVFCTIKMSADSAYHTNDTQKRKYSSILVFWGCNDLFTKCVSLSYTDDANIVIYQYMYSLMFSEQCPKTRITPLSSHIYSPFFHAAKGQAGDVHDLALLSGTYVCP